MASLTIAFSKVKELPNTIPHMSEEVEDLLIDFIKSQFNGSERVTIQLEHYQRPLIEAMYKVHTQMGHFFGPTQLSRVKEFLSGDDVFSRVSAPITSLKKLHEILSLINSSMKYNYKMQLMGKTIPVEVKVEYHKGGGYGPANMTLEAKIALSQEKKMSILSEYLYKEHLFDDDNKPKFETILKYLESISLDPFIEEEDIKDYVILCRNAMIYSEDTGKPVTVNGPAISIYSYAWFKGFETSELISEAIVEPTLEEDDADYYTRNQNKDSIYPFIRVFSLLTKRYYYMFHKYVKTKKWDGRSFRRLVLPEDMKDLLKGLFKAKSEDLAIDIVKGNAGGMIIMASGPAGIGKTATAISYSEISKKPLYIMDIAELGTDPNNIEEKLQKVFIRVQRWGAIMLLDEVDIFFAKRDTNLQRSAVVGIFLRTLDQFSGILFLTTNRPEVIDDAFRSRITVHLKYPALDEAARTKIWKYFIKDMGINISDIENLSDISDIELNGREIRNKARVVKVIHDGNLITIADMITLINLTQ